MASIEVRDGLSNAEVRDTDNRNRYLVAPPQHYPCPHRFLLHIPTLQVRAR